MWRSAWLRAHPGEHAKLTLRVLDFRGNVNWKQNVSDLKLRDVVGAGVMRVALVVSIRSM